MNQEHLFATFVLDRLLGVEIALPAERVVEAMPLDAALQFIPTGAPFLEGILSLRGEVIPVMNLKKRLGLPETKYQQDAKVAVIQGQLKRYGLLVDDIRDVLRVPSHAVEPLDAFLLTEETVITDLIKVEQGNRVVELLDVRRLLPENCALQGEPVDPSQHRPVVQRTYSQFVIYSCRNQYYGIPVGDAREICFFHAIDQTFKSGKVEGALQLRGQTIPVLCSATLLGCTDHAPAAGEDTRILVLQSADLSFGLIVDAIHQILVVADDEIMPIPGDKLPHLLGVCHHDKYHNIMLINVQELVSSQVERITAMARLKRQESESALAAAATRHVITEHCYLVFAIGKHYAIELKDVQEIIDSGHFMETGSEGLVQGILNLRGRIVPVMSLRTFYNCPEHNVTHKERSHDDKLIIGRANGDLVALLVDEIVTIYKQEQYHLTPSLRPELQSKKDTLDRLIEFIDDNGMKEHVLVVNVANIIRNHLLIPDENTSEFGAVDAPEQV